MVNLRIQSDSYELVHLQWIYHISGLNGVSDCCGCNFFRKALFAQLTHHLADLTATDCPCNEGDSRWCMNELHLLFSLHEVLQITNSVHVK